MTVVSGRPVRAVASVEAEVIHRRQLRCVYLIVS